MSPSAPCDRSAEGGGQIIRFPFFRLHAPFFCFILRPWLDVGNRFIPPGEFLDEGPRKPHHAHATSSSTEAESHHSRSAIWHWHGYKANQIRCLFDRIKDGQWDVAAKSTEKGPTDSDVPGCEVKCQTYHFHTAVSYCFLNITLPNTIFIFLSFRW